tara:strand:- start:411 stop:782 length:372 start_codon:yes stop_codon:yes gene_type:complete
MKMAVEEPQGPCPCGGTICNRGFGWVMGKMQDLAGGFHSSRHNVEVCEMFPDELKEWDGEDAIFLPPPPPGINNIETLKGFMKDFRGTDKDLQKGNQGIKSSERALERMERKKYDDAFREEFA